MARPDARRGEAPRANPPSLARLLLGLARAGPSGSPEARPPLPSSYPSWGTRERNLGLLCNPPTRRCLEVLPVRSGHLCGLRGLWTPVAQGAFSFRNRKSKLTRTRTHRHKRTLTTRTCSDLCRTTATATETHPRPLILEMTAVSWSNREVAVNKPRNTQKQEERNTHKRSCGDMECGPLRHRCPHPGEPWEAERQRPGAALQRSSCTETPGLCRSPSLVHQVGFEWILSSSAGAPPGVWSIFLYFPWGKQHEPANWRRHLM
ncbi:uncharacterized protein LOC225609 isoform X2 [Mus musculus]|uniref:uncharacterized protein LOC225609 isoform X2 n=1 Tax=Mus musculus TaxID=10090 RepID=UPI0016763E4A|nr:uncharacterized protein LOC225609 isoform X2 [Mus musculus]